MELDTSETLQTATATATSTTNTNTTNTSTTTSNNTNGNTSNNINNTMTANNNNSNNSSQSRIDNDGGNMNNNHNSQASLSINFNGLKQNYDTDVVRLIGQHLVSLGLKQTVDSLLKESGLSGLDHPVASKFREHILAGEWDIATEMIDEVANHSQGDKKANIREMRLMIAEHKFLELIEDEQHIKALKCLRSEITPLAQEGDQKRIQQLATILMCKSIDEVRSRANWPGKGLQSRQGLVEKFQRFIPPMIMLPPKRLNKLLSQAVELQHERCILHIANSKEPDSNTYHDLKSDHVCSSDRFPLQSVQELDNHKNEVWYCKFSNDGTKLATGGLGGKVKIWDLDREEQKLSEKYSLDCGSYSVTCLSWSPNDAYLLACGTEDRPDLHLFDVDKGETYKTINHSDDESMTTCSWHMSGDIFAAASIKGNFTIYDREGRKQGSREGVRIQCLSFLHKDPTCILASDSLNRIKSYSINPSKDIKMSLETDEEDILEERNPIMSFTVDRDDRFIAVNLMEQGVHLWDYKLKTLLRMFAGVSQRNFTIYSSFSSPDPTFIASGSEDGRVYIYNYQKEQAVAILSGHSRCVNCVTWNPRFPELLVSVSDDRLVRLWAPLPQTNRKKSDRNGNGHNFLG